MERTVFIVSDGTGITAESLGNSLMTQFENIQFQKQVIPYVDSIDKADMVVSQINTCATQTNTKPLVFMTLVDSAICQRIKESNASHFDFFNTFLGQLEQTLEVRSSCTIGRAHGVANFQAYEHRIEAVNYALSHDDGVRLQNYDKADIILIGVSRSGKTPSCLYMALQFGILAANYPLTEEDLKNPGLPKSLVPHKTKLFGLTIDPERLQNIRSERRPNSRYASSEQCRIEISEVETMYKKHNIPFLNSTKYSIEEIATKILAAAKMKRKI